MKNFYWIDSFDGYPHTMDHAIRSSLDTYQNIYPQYTERFGYRFILVSLEDLVIECSLDIKIHHARYGNLLDRGGAAYVGLIHPAPQKERKLETIYRIFANDARVVLLNYTHAYPMVCKNKFIGIGIAQKLGLPVLPTSLMDASSTYRTHQNATEEALKSYPVFVRPVDLTGGLGKKVIYSLTDLHNYLDHPPFPGRMYIVQPYIPVEAEYRVYLDGVKIVACRKRALPHGGTACETPREIEAGSQALAADLKTTYLCVDWIWSGSGFWFCEFETGGGFTELCEPYRSFVASAFFRKLALANNRGG